MHLLKEQEIKDIMTPSIEENHTYGLIEDDDNYFATEPEEEVIEVEQMEAAERAERFAELDAAEALTRNRRRNKMAYYRTTPAYETRMELRLKKALKRFKKMKKIFIPHTMYDPYGRCLLSWLIVDNLWIHTLENFNEQIIQKCHLTLQMLSKRLRILQVLLCGLLSHVEHDITFY